MPSKPLRPCVVHGCRGFSTGNGYCNDHQDIYQEKKREQHRKLDNKRGSSTQRGYDGQWRKVRRLKFLDNPLCEWCEANGLVVAAQEIHHKIPIKEAPEKRLEMDNLESLCRACHETTKG